MRIIITVPAPSQNEDEAHHADQGRHDQGNDGEKGERSSSPGTRNAGAGRHKVMPMSEVVMTVAIPEKGIQQALR